MCRGGRLRTGLMVESEIERCHGATVSESPHTTQWVFALSILMGHTLRAEPPDWSPSVLGFVVVTPE